MKQRSMLDYLQEQSTHSIIDKMQRRNVVKDLFTCYSLLDQRNTDTNKEIEM